MVLPSWARRVLAAVAGVGLIVGGWLLVVPWDWSTRRDGRPIVDAPGDGQTVGRALVLLAAALVVAAVVAVVARIGEGIVLWVASGVTWIVMVQWRAWSAEVGGANMAMLWVPVGAFLVCVGTCVVAVAGAIAGTVRRRSGR